MPPTMLIEALEGVRRRVRLLSVLFGVGLLVATAVGALIVTILVDYFLNLAPVPRLVVILAAVGAIGYVLFRYVVQPLWAKLTLSDVAGKLETAFPQFDDRLRSTVNFLRADVPGSDRMKDRVVTETTQLARSLDLNRAIVTTPVWYSAGAGLGAIVLALLLATVVGDTYRDIAFSRLFRPFGGQAWPKRVQIEMLSAVPRKVPVGQRLDLSMKLSKGDKVSLKSTVLYRYGDGPWQRELMSRTADGTYAASLDARVEPGKDQGTLQVRVLAGDDAQDLEPITILPRLQVTSVQAVVTPPKYVTGESARQPVTLDLTSVPAVMAAGSELALKVGFNKPLSGGEQPVKLISVSEEMKLPEIAWAAGQGGVVGKWAAAESLRFHIKATDTDGFTNTGIEEYELIVRPDQQPTVQIEQPRRNEERTPVATVPLQAVAEDDYGVESVKLVVDRVSGGEKKHWEIDLVAAGAATGGVKWDRIEGSGDRIRFRANYVWDLAALKDANLKPGDVLEYFLLAKDNFALNGATHEPVASGKLRINVISQEQLTDALTAQLRNLATNLTEIKNGQTRTKEETAGLAQETAEKEALDEADRQQAERLAGQQGTSAAQTKQVAAKLDQVRQALAENKSPNKELDELSREVRDTLNAAAEQPMKAAAGELSKANQPQQQRDQRNEAMQSAVANQQQATDQLQKALDRMGSIGSLQQTIDKFKDILAKQQELSKQTREVGKNNIGKTPQQMSPEDRKRLEDVANQQQQLSERTQKAIEESKKTADSMKKSDPASAEAMSKAAQTGQQQQVSPNQQKASQSARQNQQSQAQQAQKQAELGLEMIINQLREAERRKLDELSKKLDDLQKQIANLIRRQAGHNLDNLGVQGPERVKQLKEDELAGLLERAERVKDAMPPVPPLPTLTTGQEQTERNTRDVARTAEDVPSGAEPSAHLTRAAGRMERAIVSLRKKNAAEAYAPPQVEALAALEEALRVVDEQKQEVDEKIQQQQQEAVRQAYERIKAAQVELNAKTSDIEKNRNPDGTLKRPDAIALGQLPGQQGGLADEITKLEEALSAVGSIVYIWANKDIAQAMTGVKEDLGKQQTGPITQAEQTRVVDQLDAMIRNLAIKPRDQKFDRRNANAGGGGGQGQQQTPGLPSEAELRLLKDLQIAVNKSTKTIDGQPDKKAAEPRLVGLGTRQGELRNLLDEMMQKNSGGKTRLGPEPDPKDLLPEEASKEDVENQELDEDLLNDKPEAERVTAEMNLVGDRMGRSRQRLAINRDPGKTTQLIQERILLDLDKLIDQAEKEGQAQASAQPRPGGQRPQQPQPGEQQAENQGEQQGQQPITTAQNPAQESLLTQGGEPQADLRTQIEESQREWGQISPRALEAAREGANDDPIDKYRKLVEDYYRGVATRGTERQ